MYSVTGKINQQNDQVLFCTMLTSKGQNGGAVTANDTGTILGIYTDVVDHQDMGDKYGMCVRISTDIIDWIDGI